MSKVIVRGVSYEIPDKLTLGETCDIESVTGTDGTSEAGRLRRTAAMVWVAMRRREPATTWAQIRALDWEDVDFVNDEPEPEDEAVPPARPAAHDEPTGAAV